jgi:hypothetical protein
MTSAMPLQQIERIFPRATSLVLALHAKPISAAIPDINCAFLLTPGFHLCLNSPELRFPGHVLLYDNKLHL